jgi:hypothetical protein
MVSFAAPVLLAKLRLCLEVFITQAHILMSSFILSCCDYQGLRDSNFNRDGARLNVSAFFWKPGSSYAQHTETCRLLPIVRNSGRVAGCDTKIVKRCCMGGCRKCSDKRHRRRSRGHFAWKLKTYRPYLKSEHNSSRFIILTYSSRPSGLLESTFTPLV